MPQLAPPMPPRIVAHEGEGRPLDRLRLRMYQVVILSMTLLATVWCFLIDPEYRLGIIAVVVAKHVVVAVLAMGVGVDRPIDLEFRNDAGAGS